MRHAILPSLFPFVAHVYGQEIQIHPTTEEEFNYLSKGYRVQMESGQEMKKGYVFEDYGQPVQLGNYTYQFKCLMREARKELAGILVINQIGRHDQEVLFLYPGQKPGAESAVL